jgi:mRNA-degrading endonuclease RelE of RelBE toxin-antitoxin system
MVTVILDKHFVSTFSKIHDKKIRERIKNQIIKIKYNPRVGWPMRYGRKGTRKLYVKPYRLSYAYNAREKKIYILTLYHKKHQSK